MGALVKFILSVSERAGSGIKTKLLSLPMAQTEQSVE
jgi:hypothetical protein